VICRSPHLDISIPEIPLTAFVGHGGRDFGDKPALIDGPSGRTLSFADLAADISKAAVGLARRGLRKGDVFAIFAPNTPEWVVAFHAVASIGGVVTPVNSLFTVDDVSYQLNDAGARFLLTAPAFMDRAVDAAERTGIEEVFVIGEAQGATPFSSLLDENGDPPEVGIDPKEDLVVLPYSSGTTGFPKGVMLTHFNVVANICQLLRVHRISASDRLIGVLPFSHIYGMVVTMSAGLCRGATIVTMPRFDLEPFLQILQDHGVTRAHLVPPIVLALAKHPLVDNYDLSSLRLVLSGAAPLDARLAGACEERLGIRVIQGYGLTETSPVTHMTPDDPAKNRPGSVGQLIPNTEAQVINWGTLENLGPNRDGEIWIRGPQVMKGYLNNWEATTRTIDEDGWLRTGDIGHVDTDGYFTIVDRLKELIKYKGYQVPPAELEAVLFSHPAVADAAVIPKPDEEAGEIPKAFIVAKGDVTTEAIMAFVADRVASYKKIRDVEFVGEIPKSASGKILRRILVERERSKR